MFETLRHILSHIAHGSLRESYFLLFGGAGVIALVTGFGGAWLGARFVALRAVREQARSLDGTVTRADVQHLSDGMEALALELERLAEGQRFVAKVLSEKREAAPLPAPRREPGVITPH